MRRDARRRRGRCRGSRERSSTPASGRGPGLPRRLFDRGAPLERLPPLAVARVPADGLFEPGAEVDRGPPAELALDLRGIEEIAAGVGPPGGGDRLPPGGLVPGG